MAKRVIVKVPSSVNVSKLTEKDVDSMIKGATKGSGLEAAARALGINADQLVIQQGDENDTEIGPKSWSAWTRSC